MFRHKGEPTNPDSNKERVELVTENNPVEKKEKKSQDISKATTTTSDSSKLVSKKEFTLQTVGELMEKNLKWSQIIYEQNRRINRKLIWMSVMSWLKVAVVAAVLVLGLWFLPPLLNNVFGQYQALLGGEVNAGLNASRNANNQMLQKLFQLLPLDSAQQEQIKTILK